MIKDKNIDFELGKLQKQIDRGSAIAVTPKATSSFISQSLGQAFNGGIGDDTSYRLLVGPADKSLETFAIANSVDKINVSGLSLDVLDGEIVSLYESYISLQQSVGAIGSRSTMFSNSSGRLSAIECLSGVNGSALIISADDIQINGTVTFSTGYDVSGKAKVFRQATAPVSGMNTGDLWIDTDAGDKPYSYNGASWVAAYTQINGGHITTGTIDASVVSIANLNTSDLTNDSGFVTSTGANTFYTSTEPTVAADDLKVGDFWFDTNAGVYRMKRCATVGPVTWDIVSVYIDSNGLYAGTIDAGKITTGTLSIARINQSDINTSNITNGAGWTDDTTANTKVLTFYQATAPSTGNPEGSIWFDSDSLNDIYRLESSVWVLKVGIGAGLGTYIDASGIYTGSLTASQINAVTINAVDITGGTITGTTITGATLQTSSSNPKVVIDTSNSIKFYDSIGNIATLASSGTTGLSINRNFFLNPLSGSPSHLYFFNANQTSSASIYNSGSTGVSVIQFDADITTGFSSADFYTLKTNSVERISSAGVLSNVSGNISLFTNDSGYLTSSFTGSSNIVTLGTITTGTWNAGELITSVACRPSTNNTQYLGTGSYFWVEGDIYDVRYFVLTNLSDRRLKKNISDYTVNALDIIEKLQPVNYEWKSSEGKHLGFIAQDMEKVLPDLVIETDDEIKSKAVRYMEMIPVLVKALQELDERTKHIGKK